MKITIWKRFLPEIQRNHFSVHDNDFDNNGNSDIKSNFNYYSPFQNGTSK